MFCSTCGSVVTDDAAFCAKCGNAIIRAPQQQTTHSHRQQQTYINTSDQFSAKTADSVNVVDSTGAVNTASTAKGVSLLMKLIIAIAAAGVVIAGVLFIPPLMKSQSEPASQIESPTASPSSSTDKPTPVLPSNDGGIAAGSTSGSDGVFNRDEEEQPAYFTYGNTSGNIANGGYVAVQGDTIYFTTYSRYQNNSDGALYKMTLDCTGSQQICDDSAWYLNIVGDTIYYCNDYQIYSIKTDGSDRQVVSHDAAYFLNVVNDRIYYIHNSYGMGRTGEGKIHSVKTDGSDEHSITADSTYCFIVVGDTIYYSNYNDGGKLYSIKTDGSDRIKLNDDSSDRINAADGYIYYCNADDGGRIYRISIDGSDRRLFVDVRSSYVNVVGDTIYYNDRSNHDYLYSRKTDGAYGVGRLNQDSSQYINVAGDWVFYSATGDNGYLYCVSADGSERFVVSP